MNSNNIVKQQSDFILYTSNDGNVNVEVFLQEETIWLTQKAISNLFGKSKATISEHLKKIYAEGELQMDSTVRNFRTVQTEGSRQIERDLEFYNLDAIIAVGYRVNSYQATQFRIWEGRVSALEAKLKAEQEFDKYRVIQDRNFISDFDKEIKRIKGIKHA